MKAPLAIVAGGALFLVVDLCGAVCLIFFYTCKNYLLLWL